MKSSKKILVTISALAMRACLQPSAALAQVQISCPQNIRFGHIVTCGANTVMNLTASGSAAFAGGCSITTQAAMVGQCIVRTGGTPPTGNVIVKVTTNNIDISNAGNDILVNNFRLLYTGTTSPQTQLTLTPAEVAGTITVDFGARFNFSGSNPLGSYAGAITVTAN